MSTFRRDSSSSPTGTGPVQRSRQPVDWGTLRGTRLRARELGILREFWELVSAGDLDGARERLALEQQLEEERIRQRRASTLSILTLAVTVCATVIWWLLRDLP